MKRPNRPSVTFWTGVLAAAILLPALYGFGTKFRELLLLVGDTEGAFTVVPILNYLLVSAGFVLLFVWAIMHGMFRDVEKPKQDMLANEQRLDEEIESEKEALEEWHGHA